MLMVPLLLCSLVRALPSRCQAHENGGEDSSVKPYGQRVAPIGDALYTPGPRPEEYENDDDDEEGNVVANEPPLPDSAPNTDSAARIADTKDASSPADERTPPPPPPPSPPPTPSPSPSPGPAENDCACGYILSSHSNTYFPSSHITTFSSLPQGPLQVSDLAKLGFEVNNQWQVGGEYQGTRSVGSINALSGVDGALAMTVKGGQRMGGDIEAAEIVFQPEGGMVGGVFGMEAMLSSTPGTCQSIVSVICIR